MPSLSINGWAIPVAQAAQDDIEIGGTWRRAYSGRLRRSRRGIKRQWTLTTSPMVHTDAAAFEGMLLAHGEQLPGNDAFTAKGTRPFQDNGITVVGGAGRYGSALWPRREVLNLLSANVSTGSDALSTTEGWSICQGNGSYGNTTAGASALESSTSAAWQGSRSILATFVSGNYYALRVNAAVAANTQYTFSVYLKSVGGAAALEISVIAQNDQASSPYNIGFATTTSWARYALTFTTPAAATAIDIRIGERVDNAYVFFADGAMLQPGGAATDWVATTSPATNVAYDVAEEASRGGDAITLHGWAISPTAIGGVFAALSDLAVAQIIKIYYSATNQLAVSHVGGTVVAAWASPTTYTHVAAVVTPTTTTLYLGGVVVATGPGVGAGAISQLTRLWFGNLNQTNAWGGYIDELAFAPYAMCPAQIAGIAALTVAPATQPALLAGGSLIGEQISVLASDIRSTYQSMGVDGAWQTNMAIIDFTLSEV